MSSADKEGVAISAVSLLVLELLHKMQSSLLAQQGSNPICLAVDNVNIIALVMFTLTTAGECRKCACQL